MSVLLLATQCRRVSVNSVVKHPKAALLEIGLPNTGHSPKAACGPKAVVAADPWTKTVLASTCELRLNPQANLLTLSRLYLLE